MLMLRIATISSLKRRRVGDKLVNQRSIHFVEFLE